MGRGSERITLRRTAASLIPLLLLLLVSGCASPGRSPAHPPRAFAFSYDTFSYANELVWEYNYDAEGNWTTKPRDPKPTYSLRCFVVTRSAKQFFQNARFDPSQPIADDATYRKKIHQVVTMGARKPPPEVNKVVIPGFANLREFSAARPDLLKTECGSAWESYLQRGHWRMVFPFSRQHQEKVALQTLTQLEEDRPVVLHILTFPHLSINHGLLAYDADVTDEEIRFHVYDPNAPDTPTTLTFERRSRTFILPQNKYFRGGPVNAYPVYWDWLH